jgi:signal transduction histidine kinase
MLVVLIAVVSVAVPVSYLMRRTIHAEVHYRLELQAEALSQHFTEEVLKGDTVEDEVNADTPPGHRLTVVNPDGTKVTQGPQERFSSEIDAVVPGPNGSTLTLSTTGDSANERTATAVLVIGLVSLLVIVAAVLLSWWQARRLAAPLAKVAASADEMGSGDLETRASLSGMPEIDAVAEALNRLAGRVNELVQAERDFSTNASHQLRGGLTSLRLRLEALERTTDHKSKADAKAALQEAEKLSATVNDLLQLARTGRAGEASRYDLARVVRQHVAKIQPQARKVGRDIRMYSAGASADVVGSPSAVGQAVDVLLSNALMHGGGAIRVDVTAVDGAMCVTVADQGVGIAEESRATLFSRRPDDNGHGIGLALARTLVEAEGGRLDLVQPRPPVFEFILPVSPDE